MHTSIHNTVANHHNAAPQRASFTMTDVTPVLNLCKICMLHMCIHIHMYIHTHIHVNIYMYEHIYIYILLRKNTVQQDCLTIISIFHLHIFNTHLLCNVRAMLLITHIFFHTITYSIVWSIKTHLNTHAVCIH